MLFRSLLILIEMVAVVVLGFLPETAPFQISQITINFICSMQYNTFRQAQGVPMATTFCTNHLRQIGIAIVKGARNSSDENHVKRMKEHVKMLILFVIGATISAMLCNIFLGKAIWFALIPLTIVFSGLLYADRKIEQDMIEATPKGH